MRAVFRFSGLLLLVALVAGCPRPIDRQHEFTTAAPGGRGLFDGATPAAPGEDVANDDGGGETPRAVVEPDVIRRAGNLLYILNQYRGLMIVDLDSNALLAAAPTYGFPRDLYLAGNRAYVLVSYAGNTAVADDVVSIDLSSRLYVLDVSNPAAPAVLADFDLEGDLIDSRLVGDVLYAVSGAYQWYWPGGDGDGGTADGGTGVVTPEKQATGETWVTSVAIGDPDAIGVVDTQRLDGYGNLIQASSEAIFVAAGDWSSNTTEITYVDIADPAGAIAVRGSVAVAGMVPDRFKMDAYNGVLRVVSATWWPERKVHVTTVSLADPAALAILGETDIEGARGETLFATRFDGPRAYVVTYFIIDPLFVLDLSDPAAPKVSGVLEVPGWSTHIEPMGDRLLALGVDDTEGQRRVSVSLFDVADPAAPGLLDRVSFGEGWAWSSAFDDVKALTVLDDLVIVPFAGWSGEAGGFDRLQLVTYAGSDLTLEGFVDLQGQIKRSLEYGSLLYGVTTEELAAIDTADRANPVVAQRLTLAENVTDYQELGPNLGAQIVSRWDDGDTLVRTVDAAGAPLGSVAVETPNLSASFAYGDSVVLVSTAWEDRGYYSVVVVDCSDPAAPAIADTIKVDIDPFWGWWWWDGPVFDAERGGDAVPPAEKDVAWWGPWWWTPGDVAFLAGDTLVLRGYAESFDETLGGGPAQSGLALVDLDAGEVTDIVGLAVPNLQVIRESGGKLYLSNIEERGADEIGRALAAYYIREFDPAGPSLGPAANVPGAIVQYDPATDVLVCEDLQYTRVYDVERSLASVAWDGGDTAELVDRYPLPAATGQVLGRGSRIVYGTWDGAAKIGSVKVAGDGGLSAGAVFGVSNLWSSLIDASADRAYAAVGGYAVAIYRLDDGSLERLEPVMSTPWRIRFGSAAAYAPLGYAGLLTLPYPGA